MPKGYSPAVFVSSTCYDLSQIRADLKIFLESVGLDPVLSEHNSFPVNPNYDTISNCLETVRNRADILVLVVGGRYGFQTDSGKSVTNLEYLEAKVKGIPVYVFVSKSVINILPIWEKNKEADYSNVVDTPKLLEFVDILKHESENWVFPFESAQDLIKVLRSQLAYLFMDALEYRALIHGKELGIEYTGLSPVALEILFTKPEAWGYTLFSQILRDKIESYSKERFDLRYGVNFGKAIKIDEIHELGDWMSSHMSEAESTIQSVTRLINDGLPVAFGEPGSPGDEKHISYIANRIGEGYKKLIDWALEFKNVKTGKEYERVVELGSHISDNAILEIEEFSKRIHKEINEAVLQIDSYTETRTIELTLTVTTPDMTEFNNEVDRLLHLSQ